MKRPILAEPKPPEKIDPEKALLEAIGKFQRAHGKSEEPVVVSSDHVTIGPKRLLKWDLADIQRRDPKMFEMILSRAFRVRD